MDGWMAGGMDRERGGDAGVFPGTAFSCAHSIHTTTDRAGRCIKPHIQRNTHKHKNTLLLLELPQYQGSRDVHVFA